MPFILIKGTFHVVGYSPDGDSIKFNANDPKNWKKVQGHVEQNNKGYVQLRFEGIDALETHYRPPVKGAKEKHQPLLYAQAARDLLLALVGIKDVQWGPSGREVVQAKDGVSGYILTREVDNNRYGRPVAFVYAGSINKQDGSDNVRLTPTWLRQSVNYKILAAGYAYPTYYQTLFSDLRSEFTRAVQKARNAKPKRGIWKADKTGGFTFTGETDITDKYPLFPKLFRRLEEHLAGGGTLKTFDAFLAQKKDGVLILPQAHHTDALDYVVEVKNNRLKMKVLPENLVFDPQG